MSIAALGRALRGAVAEDPRGALERAAWTVALRTEAVMRRHCRPLRQVCADPSAGGSRPWALPRFGASRWAHGPAAIPCPGGWA